MHSQVILLAIACIITYNVIKGMNMHLTVKFAFKYIENACPCVLLDTGKLLHDSLTYGSCQESVNAWIQAYVEFKHNNMI